MIAIVDCKIGNIGSIYNAFSYIGSPPSVVSSPGELDRYDAIVLPGVGAFDAAMSSMQSSGFVKPIKDFVKSGRAVLGICLGLQVLCSNSEEGVTEGLDLVKGSVRNLKTLGCTGKIPHVGFNSICSTEGTSTLLSSVWGHDFYFVHSFALEHVVGDPDDISVAYTEYNGARFVSAIHYKNIFATQFHPEKSGEAGLRVLSEFLSCSKNA